MSTLRLFPLDTVLFPGMPLSLHVFEDRYRALISECLAANEPFGVALIREGGEVGGSAVPFDVGTTAAIESVTPVGGGRLAVVARGVRRFRIARPLHDSTYPFAEVEYPVDEVAAPSEEALREAGARFAHLRRLQQTIEGTWAREIHVPSSAGALADAIGAAAVGIVPPRDLQPLLEELDVRRRLERAESALTAVLEATHQLAQQAVTARWGGPERSN